MQRLILLLAVMVWGCGDTTKIYNPVPAKTCYKQVWVHGKRVWAPTPCPSPSPCP